MTNHKSRIGWLLGSLCLVMVGCVTEVETPHDDVTPARANEAQPERAKKRFRGHGPSAMLIQTALDELELTPAQQSSLEDLLEDTRPSEAGQDAHKELLVALATGLRAGAIDDDLVGAKLTAVKQISSEMHDKRVASLDTLHATLTSAQRVALVEIVRERGEKMRQHFESKKGEKEHHARHHETKKGHPPLWFARGLDMTDEQRENLKSALAESGMEKPTPEAMKERFATMRANMKAMFDAFATGEFEAKSHIDADAADNVLEHYIEVVKILSVILDDAQRDKLADRIEKGPQWGHKGREKQPEAE